MDRPANSSLSSLLFDETRYAGSTGMDNWGALIAEQQWSVQRPLARCASAANDLVEGVEARWGRLLYGKPA